MALTLADLVPKPQKMKVLDMNANLTINSGRTAGNAVLVQQFYYFDVQWIKQHLATF